MILFDADDFHEAEGTTVDARNSITLRMFRFLLVLLILSSEGLALDPTKGDDHPNDRPPAYHPADK
jgi:hypothetical protein